MDFPGRRGFGAGFGLWIFRAGGGSGPDLDCGFLGRRGFQWYATNLCRLSEVANFKEIIIQRKTLKYLAIEDINTVRSDRGVAHNNFGKYMKTVPVAIRPQKMYDMMASGDGKYGPPLQRLFGPYRLQRNDLKNERINPEGGGNIPSYFRHHVPLLRKHLEDQDDGKKYADEPWTVIETPAPETYADEVTPVLKMETSKCDVYKEMVTVNHVDVTIDESGKTFPHLNLTVKPESTTSFSEFTRIELDLSSTFYLYKNPDTSDDDQKKEEQMFAFEMVERNSTDSKQLQLKLFQNRF